VSPPVHVHLFATARQIVGRARLAWPLPEDGLTARQLVAAIEAA